MTVYIYIYIYIYIFMYCNHAPQLRGCFGAGAPMGKNFVGARLRTHRNLPPFCNFFYQNASVLCADS